MVPDPPQWITPAQAGLITNSAGSNSTAFSPPLSLRYSSPAGADDGPVAARYKMTQTRLKGSVINPTVVYDSGWGRPAMQATGATTPLPMKATLTGRGALWAESVGRVYCFDYAQHQVWSAPVSGLSVGSWRAENPPPSSWRLFGDPQLICGQIFCLSTSGIVQVPLNTDGTLGQWVYAGASGGPVAAAQGAPTPASAINYGAGLVGLDYGEGRGGVLVVLNTAGVGTVFSYQIDPTTGTVASQIQGPNVPLTAGFVNGAAWFDTSWWPGSTYSGSTIYLHLIAGQNTATHWTTLTVPPGANPGTFGASWSTGAPLPNTLYRFGLATTPQMLTGGRLNGPDWGKDQDIYLFGGLTADNTTPISSILAISGVNFRSGASGRWGTVTPPQGWTPAANCGACAWPMPGANHSIPAFCMGQFGGTSDNTDSVPVLAPMTFFPGQLASAPANSTAPAYAPGINAPLPVTQGAGAIMPEAVPQGDGSYVYTFAPALPAAGWGGPFDGDQYTVEVDFASCQSGDPSPAALTTLSFAKAPQILNVSPQGTTTDGSPTVTFTYLAGAFGGPMQAWRAVISLGDTTLADSGLQSGDTSWTPGPAPCLAPGHTYGLQIQVWSTDEALTDQDSVSALWTGSFTPSYASPDSPFAFLCAQDVQRGAVLAQWENPPGVAFNRIYYRLTKSEDKTWWLLQEGIHADPQGGTNQLTLIDQLALRQYYDFAVTGLDSSQTRESGVTIAIANGDMEEAGVATSQAGKQTMLQESFEQPPVQTVLWRSLGTDAMNSPDGWTIVGNLNQGGSTVTDNVMHQGASGVAIAGHPDWQDGTFTVRVTIPPAGAACWPRMMVHVGPGGGSWLSFEWVPSQQFGVAAQSGRLRLWCNSPQYGGDITTLTTAIPQQGGASYWMTLTAQDHNLTGHLYSDAAGQVGTLLGSVSGTFWPTAVGAGQVMLACYAGEVIWGGPYPNVCTWSGPAPSGWLPTMPQGALPQDTTNVLDDSFNDLSNWQQMTATPATVAGNQVTITGQSGILSSEDDYQDGVYTVRWQQGTGTFSGWVLVRASYIGGPAVVNGVIVGWNGNYSNPGVLYINSSDATNKWLPAGQTSQSYYFTPGAWYWMVVRCQGPNITAQAYSDNAGAIGSLLLSTSAYLPQFKAGSVGFFNNSAIGTAPCLVGHATYDALPPVGTIEPAGTPAGLQQVWSDTFADLSQWQQATTTNATVAGNVITMPRASGVFSNQIYGDGVWTLRVQNNQNTLGNQNGWPPFIFLRATPWTQTYSPLGSASSKPDSIQFQWNGALAQSGKWNFALFKNLGGQQTYIAGMQQQVVVAAGQWVWVRAIMKGPHITCQMYSDNAGAMGTLLAEVSGYVPDAALQQGRLGFVNNDTPTTQSAYAMGGNYAGVCKFEQFTPASGPGEPSFCHSWWQAQDGVRSVSIFQPQGQTLVAPGPSWSWAFESSMIPVQPDSYYNLAVQVNSSAPSNTALQVLEYDPGGTLLRSTQITGAGAGTAWLPSYVITAQGSSANYTNASRGTQLRQAPSMDATVLGSLLEGQPAIVVAAQVPDQQTAAQSWWPIAWNQGIAYLWTADAPGPQTTTRGGLQPQIASLSGPLVPMDETAYLAVRVVAIGPGLHYWDQVVVTSLPNTATALFTSIGSDATGTLDAWTLQSATEAPYLVAVGDDSPVSWWRLDDADDGDPTLALDWLGNHASLVGEVVRGVPSPILGDDRAMAFDDTSKLLLPNDTQVGTESGDAWTLEMWFLADQDGNVPGSPLFSNVYGEEQALLAISETGELTWTNGTVTLTLTGVDVRDGDWHQLVLTNDESATVTLYLDGGTAAGGSQVDLPAGGGRLFFPEGMNPPTVGGRPLRVPDGAPLNLTATPMQAAALLDWDAPQQESDALPVTGYLIQGDMSDWSNQVLSTPNLFTYWPLNGKGGAGGEQALGSTRIPMTTSAAGFTSGSPGLLPQDTDAAMLFQPNSAVQASLPALGNTFTLIGAFRGQATLGSGAIQRLFQIPGMTYGVSVVGTASGDAVIWQPYSVSGWTAGTSQPLVAGSPRWLDGNTHWFVLRTSASGSSLWVDGQVSGTGVATTAIPTANWLLNSAGSTANLTIDEVMVIQRAITDDEITALMSAMTTARGMSTGSDTSVTVPNLIPGDAASFRIAAVNDMGVGPWSDWVSATPTWLGTTITVPGAPTIGTTTAGVQQFTARWTAPTNNGGSPITGYTLQWQDNRGGTSQDGTLGVITSRTVGGCLANCGYQARVAAKNAVGQGAWSAWSNWVTATAPATAATPTQTITVGSSSGMATGLFAASRTLLSFNFSVPRKGQIHVYGSITLRPEYWQNNEYPNGTRWVKTSAAGQSSAEALVGGTNPTWSTYYTISRDNWWAVSGAGSNTASWSVRLGGGNQVRVSGGSLTVVFQG